jgi:hypothetical protein
VSKDHLSRGRQELAPCCKGKVAFDLYTLADIAAKRARRNHDAAVVTPYKCRHCHKWHLGQHIAGEGRSPLGQFKRGRKMAAETGK